MQFEFTHNGVHYRYDYGDIQTPNKYGHYTYICEIRINDFDSLPRETQIAICIAALQGYQEGVREGKELKTNEILNVLGVDRR